MIEEAAFETGILGRPVWRVTATADGERLAAGLAMCPHHVIAKVAGDDPAGINRLLTLGFRYSCASIRMARHGLSPVAAPAGATVSALVEADLPDAGTISDTAFAARNRFADDPLLGPVSNAIHRRWLANSLEGYAQACLKAEADGRLAGFATLHLAAPTSSIGLIAVDPAMRGRGIGHALFACLTDLAAAAGCTAMQVVTESENRAALDFYSGLGFRHAGSELSLYRPAP